MSNQWPGFARASLIKCVMSFTGMLGCTTTRWARNRYGQPREISQRVMRVRVKTWRYRPRRGGEQERVTVRRGFGTSLGADHAAGAFTILDDDLLTPRSVNSAPMYREDIAATAGRK